MNNDFNKEANTYSEDYQKGLIAGYDLARQDFLRQPSGSALEPDDFCPKTTPVEDILSIPCQNCLLEDECDYRFEGNLDEGEDWYVPRDGSINTYKIEKLDTIAEIALARLSTCNQLLSECGDDFDLYLEIKTLHDAFGEILTRVRNLQEETVVEEMYYYLNNE